MCDYLVYRCSGQFLCTNMKQQCVNTWSTEVVDKTCDTQVVSAVYTAQLQI